jgi:cysteine sulfinate desulfinase/cysteine desulfurase-like protein
MWVSNETGVLFPVERIAEICCSRGVLYHCDAVQAAGKVQIDVRKIPADYLLDKEGVCASSGSACLADSDQPSHVVNAMKPNTAASRQMIRFSIDAATTQAQIRSAVTTVVRETEALRG